MSSFDGSNLWYISWKPKIVIVQLICIILFVWSNLQVVMFAEAGQSMCNSAGEYANGSKFESNMNTVVNNLIHSAKIGLRYNSSSYGENPDKIYGLLQCRGDASQTECYNCSQDAKTEARAKCGNAIGGRVWLDMCYLRYENYSFVSTLDIQGVYAWDLPNITDPQIFNGALRSLLSNLSHNASAPANGLRYSSGSTIDSSFHKIFGLVQCWEDISLDDCTTCQRQLTKSSNGVQQNMELELRWEVAPSVMVQRNFSILRHHLLLLKRLLHADQILLQKHRVGLRRPHQIQLQRQDHQIIDIYIFTYPLIFRSNLSVLLTDLKYSVNLTAAVISRGHWRALQQFYWWQFRPVCRADRLYSLFSLKTC